MLVQDCGDDMVYWKLTTKIVLLVILKFTFFLIEFHLPRWCPLLESEYVVLE